MMDITQKERDTLCGFLEDEHLNSNQADMLGAMTGQRIPAAMFLDEFPDRDAITSLIFKGIVEYGPVICGLQFVALTESGNRHLCKYKRYS